ncbi:MAG: ABC transporter ATP-binding protein [Nocardioidaceae bacterium]
MTLTAHFAVRRPAHTTTVDLEADAGEVIGLIGPNGAGKSTTLRAIAGLLTITSGTIAFDGTVVAAPGTHLPAHRRGVGMVFQDHLLFPHLSVAANVAFGARAQGGRREAARGQAAEWLARLGLDELAERRPGQLSGGQAQRVALARALASRPRLLLLDEPTAALDAAAAMTLRTDLRDHLRAFAGVSIVVTHTALDAMVITDRLVVMDGGEIVQTGTPADIAARPRTAHVAALVGLNLVRGTARAGVVTTESGGEVTAAERLTGPVFASFPPSAVGLYSERPSGSPRNVWPGTVTTLAPHGDAVRVQVSSTPPLIADVTPAALSTLRLRPGDPVWASVKATEVSIYPV